MNTEKFRTLDPGYIRNKEINSGLVHKLLRFIYFYLD